MKMEKLKIDEFYTSKTAGEKLNLHDSMVRKLAADKKINGTKVGHAWLFTEAAIKEFKKTWTKRRGGAKDGKGIADR